MVRYFFYHGPANEAGIRNVEALLTLALNEGEPEVTLCLASHGGDGPDDQMIPVHLP